MQSTELACLPDGQRREAPSLFVDVAVCVVLFRLFGLFYLWGIYILKQIFFSVHVHAKGEMLSFIDIAYDTIFFFGQHFVSLVWFSINLIFLLCQFNFRHFDWIMNGDKVDSLILFKIRLVHILLEVFVFPPFPTLSKHNPKNWVAKNNIFSKYFKISMDIGSQFRMYSPTFWIIFSIFEIFFFLIVDVFFL